MNEPLGCGAQDKFLDPRVEGDSLVRLARINRARTDFGGHTGGVTPDPISNSEVKTSRADGTAGEALWESRSPPGTLERPGSVKDPGFSFLGSRDGRRAESRLSHRRSGEVSGRRSRGQARSILLGSRTSGSCGCWRGRSRRRRPGRYRGRTPAHSGSSWPS